jgi:AraC-like DNA-binding protein
MRRVVEVIDIQAGRLAVGQYKHSPNARKKISGSTYIPRHRHTEAFASIVLAGGLQECGSRGRFDLRPGAVLIHGAFETHLDRIFVAGAEILNLRLPALGFVSNEFGQVMDADEIVRAAENDAASAIALLQEKMVVCENPPKDWQDLLARDICDDPNRKLGDWAEAHNLSLETLSRGFGQVFGVTPAVFRSESRTRKAFQQIVEGTSALGKALEVSGFADAPQMSRAVRALTGATPKAWLFQATFGKPEH